nr:MAG TPA: hypothetical protein [Caudoviricetes sp.]
MNMLYYNQRKEIKQKNVMSLTNRRRQWYELSKRIRQTKQKCFYHKC